MKRRMNGLEVFKECLRQGIEELQKELDARFISDITGTPIEELRPKPQPPPYDPRPLHDAIISDSLVCGSVTEHGQGASETYALLHDKQRALSELSEKDYMELVRLAKIGLENEAQ